MSSIKSIKNKLSAVLAVLMSVSMVSAVSVSAETVVNINSEVPSVSTTEGAENFVYEKAVTYSDYYDSVSSAKRPDVEQYMRFIAASNETEYSVGSYENKDNVFVWSSQVGSVTYEVDVPENGAYNIEVCYFPITGGNVESEMSVLLDGASPYDTATRVAFTRIWSSKYEISTDSKGNQIRPPQVEKPQWITTSLKDGDGLFNDPLLFYFEKGRHTVTFESNKASVAIAYVKLYNEQKYPEYVKPDASELSANAGADTIKIQGENYAYTNSQALYPTYDRSSYLTEPSDPVKQRYNTIGDGTWNKSGQQITWKMNVETDGYYKIGIKARQKSMRGFYSNRKLYIDGQVPNADMAQIKFYYDNDWTMVTPMDKNGDPVYVYLTAGTHELTLEAIPGEIGDSMRRLNDIIYEMNQYYMKILMITGPTPDKYTDYYVQNQIPELIPDFKNISKQLYTERNNIEKLANQTGTEAAAIEKLEVVVNNCIKRPNKIPDMISSNSIKDNVAALSSWMRSYRQQPLEVDYIEIAPAGNDFTGVKENFFKSLAFGIKGFIGSFFEDYTILSDTNKNSINVWVSLGRDQANVVKQIVDSQFVPNSNIDVSVNLVQGSIMEAVLAGKGPDVALFVGGEFPVNLAIRGLTLPVSDMDGYDEVASRFQKNATVMYTYNGKTYGVPITQSFPMMFYRKDMLYNIGIDHPPETWDELIDMLPAIQRNYMQPGLVLPNLAVSLTPANVVAVSPATEVGHTFALLMLQSGQNYYNADQSATTFDSQTAVEAFDKWTRFYTTYKFDQQYDAFTRFRTGEAPIVITSYCTFYNQLNEAAPEIKGLWDFTSVPGTLREDGTISHAANSNGSGAIILKNCKNPEAAWEFIKWFTSTDIMVEYGQNIEGIMGPLGRFEAANVEALKQLNWSSRDLEKILRQMDALEEIPIIPSSYVVTRSIMNAFRTVVNDKENARETLIWYNRDINSEILRKRRVLGIDDNSDKQEG